MLVIYLTKEEKDKQDKFQECFKKFWISSLSFIKTWNISKQGQEVDEDCNEEAFSITTIVQTRAFKGKSINTIHK